MATFDDLQEFDTAEKLKVIHIYYSIEWIKLLASLTLSVSS